MLNWHANTYLLILNFTWNSVLQTMLIYNIVFVYFFLLCISFFFLGMVLIMASYTMLWTSIQNFSGTLSDLIPWIYLSLPLYSHKGFDLGHIWMVFPYFLQFKYEFCNRKFIIWDTISSQSCFCSLYRASPSLAAKNIINLISVLTIWWCPCVELSLVLLEEGVCYDQCDLLAKLC